MQLRLSADASLMVTFRACWQSIGCECVKIANTPDWRAILRCCSDVQETAIVIGYLHNYI